MATAASSSSLKISEKEFTKQVIDFARLNGWIVAHFRTALSQAGNWITPVQADGVGFPDLVLVRDRVLFVELKVGRNKPSEAQLEWHRRLVTAGADVFIWRPEVDWEDIEKELRRG